MKHIISIFIGLAFILWLLIPHLGLIFNVTPPDKYFQNRELHSFPKIEIDSILSSSFDKDMGNYIWDHLLFRSFFLKLDHWIDYYVFKDSPLTDMVIRGKDDWLFFRGGVLVSSKLNSEQVEQFAELVRLANIIEEQMGLDILFLPSPEKYSIYPEFLADTDLRYLNRYSPIFHNRLEDIASDTDDVLLLWDSFLMEKDRLSKQNDPDSENKERPRYLISPKGGHYGWETSIFQAKCIVEKLAPGKWQDNLYDVYLTPYRLEESEIGRFFGITLPELARSFKKDKFFQSFAINVTALDESRGIYKYTTDKHTYIDPLPFRIMVIHDSFMNKSKPFLVPYFKESIFVHWNFTDYMFSTNINVMHDIDILIIQRVEGGWFSRYDRLERVLNKLANLSTE